MTADRLVTETGEAHERIMPPKLAIIIPTYRRHDQLRGALGSVVPQCPSSTEVLVVDQSPDSTGHAVEFRTAFPCARYLCLPKPGLPGARNFGIANSSADVILFLDDDIVLMPGCIEEHLRIHREKPNVGAVAGRIRLIGETTYPDTDTVATINPHTGEAVGNFDLDYEGPVVYASGANMSIKRSVIGEIGLFNIRFRGNALFEDVEFSCRIRGKGHDIWYTPRALLHHNLCGKGGCRAVAGRKYLLQRLHNHTLFYVLHIRLLPSGAFLRYLRNLIEFTSRTDSSRHDPVLLLRAAAALLRAYLDALLSPRAGSGKRHTGGGT